MCSSDLETAKPIVDFAVPKEAAPAGPSVSPPPPATDDRPATGTSNRPPRGVSPTGDRST